MRRTMLARYMLLSCVCLSQVGSSNKMAEPKPLEYHRDLRHEKTTVPVLLYGIG